MYTVVYYKYYLYYKTCLAISCSSYYTIEPSFALSIAIRAYLPQIVIDQQIIGDAVCRIGQLESHLEGHVVRDFPAAVEWNVYKVPVPARLTTEDDRCIASSGRNFRVNPYW